MSKNDDNNDDIDAGMTTAERRRRKRRGGGLRVPSDNVPRRNSAAVVAPVPEDPSLAVSIAYSFSGETSEPMMRVDASDIADAAARPSSPGFDPRMTVPGFVPSFDPVAPDAAVTLIEPANDGAFESKTREMSVVDLESLGLQDPTDAPPPTPAPPVLPAVPSVIVSPQADRSERTKRPSAPQIPQPAQMAEDAAPLPPSGPSIKFASQPAASAPASVPPEAPVEHFPRSVSAGWSAPISNEMPAVAPPADFESFETRTSERPLFSRTERASTVALSDAEIEDIGPSEREVSDDIPVDMDDGPAELSPPPAVAASAPALPAPAPVVVEEQPRARTASTPPPPPAQAATPPPPPPAKATPPAPPPPKPAEKEKEKDKDKDKRAGEKKGKGKSWFVDVFGEDYLRTLPFLTPQATQSEAEFVLSALELQPGAQLLDVGCGYGRHAMELAARGFHVVGLDLSLPLLVRGGEEANRRGLAINFVHGDMRELDFDNQFDGAYCLFSTFGYFDDETNKKTAANIARALKPGGRLVLEILNRDYIVADLPTRVWWEGEGCVILEEVDFNYFFSRVVVNRSVVFDDGRQADQEISVRAYSLHEIGRVLHGAGFRVLEVSGGYQTKGRFFGNQSRHIVVVAEKKEDKA